MAKNNLLVTKTELNFNGIFEKRKMGFAIIKCKNFWSQNFFENQSNDYWTLDQ